MSALIFPMSEGDNVPPSSILARWRVRGKQSSGTHLDVLASFHRRGRLPFLKRASRLMMSCADCCRCLFPPLDGALKTSFGKQKSAWMASQVGTGTAMSKTSFAITSAMVPRHAFGTCLNVGICAANTSSKDGVSGGHGPVDELPIVSCPLSGGGHNGMGTSTFGDSGLTSPPSERQFVHLVPRGTALSMGVRMFEP